MPTHPEARALDVEDAWMTLVDEVMTLLPVLPFERYEKIRTAMIALSSDDSFFDRRSSVTTILELLSWCRSIPR